MGKKRKAPNWYPGPTYADETSPTGYSSDLYDLNVDAQRDEWYEAWAKHLDAKPEPVSIDEARAEREHADPYEGDPVRKARFAEAVEYIGGYVGTWDFIKNLRAHRAWGTKHFRLSDRQVEVVLNSKARDAAREVERKERAVSGLDLTSLPAGTTRYAVDNAEGEVTFIRVDHVDSGKWDGWVFVKQVVGGGDEPRLGSQRPGDMYKGTFESLLRKVLDDPFEAARRYGLELGECSDCGRTLTNAESREFGIGPKCRGKWSNAA